MAKSPPLADLHKIGITVGSQQEWWMYLYAQTVQLFPEITWLMFLDRVTKQVRETQNDAGKLQKSVSSCWQTLGESFPEAKQPARLATVCDYWGDREALLAKGVHLPLLDWIAIPKTPTDTTPPAGSEAPPAFVQSLTPAIVEPVVQPVVETPPAEPQKSLPTASGRKRGKSPAATVETPQNANTSVKRGVFAGHTPPSLYGKILLNPSQSGVPGEFMSDCGQLIEFRAGQVSPDNSPQPALPANVETYRLVISEDAEIYCNELLWRGVKPEELTEDRQVGSLDIAGGLRFELLLAAEQPPFIDGFLHNPLQIDTEQNQPLPVAELASRYYSVTGEYLFQLGSRTVRIEVCSTNTPAAAATRG